jgi:triacylglycerol lipase
MTMQLFEDAFGDPRNAQALAAACDFAYYDQTEGGGKFQNELGLTGKLISVNNTQAFVVGNDAHLVVAFRGSESPTSIDGLKDWFLTNALNLLIIPEGPLGADFAAAGTTARFHQGFVSAITAVWQPLFTEVQTQLRAKDRPLWITGHSLGGALALLAAWLFLRKTVSVHQVYTFGAPMVGNQTVAEAFNREYAGKIFRYVNMPDPVPLLPMMSLIANDFVHTDKAMPVGEGSSVGNAVELVKQMAGQFGTAVFTGHVMDDVWGAMKNRIAAHFMDDYRKRLG